MTASISASSSTHSTAPVADSSACDELALARRRPAAFGTATVMPRPIAAGVFGMARTIAVCGGKRAFEKAERAAGHDREHDRRRAEQTARASAPPSGATCGLTAITIAAASPTASAAGLSRRPRAAERRELGRRLRLDHHDVFGIEPERRASLPAWRRPSCRRRPARWCRTISASVRAPCAMMSSWQQFSRQSSSATVGSIRRCTGSCENTR